MEDLIAQESPNFLTRENQSEVKTKNIENQLEVKTKNVKLHYEVSKHFSQA
jgi:hypothetical protein